MSNGGSSGGDGGTDGGIAGVSGPGGTGGTGGTGGQGGSAGNGGSTEPVSIVPIPVAFATACTGTLLVPMPIYVGGSSGVVEEADEPVPVGTVMMLTQLIADYEGIVLLSGNRTGTVKPSFLEYLKEGTHSRATAWPRTSSR